MSIAEFYRKRQGEPASAGPDPLPVPSDSTTHNAGAFTIPLPEQWSDQTIHIFVGPVADGIQHTVTAVVDRDDVGDLDTFVDAQVAALEAALDALTIVRRESVSLIKGTPAIRVVLDWSPSPDRRLVQEQLFTVLDGKGYRLTATFTPTTFESLGPEVRAMLLAFAPS